MGAWFAAALAAWVLPILLALASPALHAQVVELTTALSAEGAASAFPVHAPGRLVHLPDEWAASRPGTRGPVWYRLAFSLPAQPLGDELLALQLVHLCSTARVQLNGHLIESAGGGDGAVASDCGHPLLRVLPGALLRPGPNVIDLRLEGRPLAEVGSRHRAAALAAPRVGPLAELRERQQWHELIQVRLRQALGASLVLTGGYMFVLGFMHRHDSHLAYFGVLSVALALHDAPLWLHGWPLPARASELALAALLGLATHAAVQFLLRYARWRHRRIDLALPVQTLLVPASLAAADEAWLHRGVTVWGVLLALEVLAAAAFYLQRQWRDRSSSLWLMGALLAVMALAGLVEAAGQFNGTPGPVVHAARLLMLATLVIVGLRLVQQHGQARRAAEADKLLLEQRVREAAAEIERNFRQLSELKIEQVTERERKRIAADLHDDLGAKLLTIVHTSESDRISTLAREALEEMRLSVRGLTGKPVRLADALGDWRAEVVSRLAQAGIEAEWSAPEDLPQTLTARAYVQTTRILREATSNIIKHSGASYCSVRCQVADGDFQLVVQDNGEGIVSEPGGLLDRGHGMATMKQRAKQMQGQCLVESGPGFGTVIRLTLPLDRALEGA